VPAAVLCTAVILMAGWPPAARAQGFLCELVPVEPGVRGVSEYQFEGDASTGPVVLDLLVVFSPGMLREGQSAIDRVVANTNSIFRESGTSVSLRVAGVRVVSSTDEETLRLIDAVEQSTRDTWSDPSRKLLRRVTEHPGFDKVRKEVGADIVVTWTNGRATGESGVRGSLK